ncbi:MAG TPA: ABC transporter substrate-binding protein [Propionibacterium sp.]|nr:ABC transporter substrate-binding protein [Propionibacterium sp.]
MSRPTITRRGVLGAVAGLTAAVLVGCSSGSPAGNATVAPTGAATATSGGAAAPAELTKISVGIIPIIDVAPIYLGVDKGFFAEEGLELTLEAGQGGAAIVPGVTSGSLQFGFSNTTSLLIANSRGLDLKVVANGASTTGESDNDFGAVLVKPDSPIQSAADLGGKKIAVNTLNNIQTTTINNQIREAGGDPTGTQYVELAFPDIVPAVERGDVDAGQVVEPFRTIGLSSEMRSVGSNYATTDPNLVIAMYFTTKDYAEKNPEIVEGFTTAMNKSLEFAEANPDEARAILGTYTKIDDAVKTDAVLPKWTPEINRNGVQVLADLGQQDGLFETAPSLDDLLP